MAKPRVLIIEDQAEQASTMVDVLTSAHDIACETALSGEEALDILGHRDFDLIITDLVLAGERDGMAVLREVKNAFPDTQVIMVSGYGTTEKAVQAMEQGAYSFLQKPLSAVELRAKAQKALERVQLLRDKRSLERRVDEKFGLEAIKGGSVAMQRVFTLVQQAAPTNATVLITGENGTGKELVANTLHQNSHRAKGPFVAFNCTEAPETLIEAILFGHEAGAFTDAKRVRRGIFEQASGGTLFLDEVGELQLHVQPKLLRVLEQRRVTPLGAENAVSVDVRILCATNRDLSEMVALGQFREDLYFRINVLEIRVPALRERLDDLPVLAAHFLSVISAEHGKQVRGFEPEVLAALVRYEWPGNVRELRNAVESMIIMSTTDMLTVDVLPPQIRGALGEGASPGTEALAGVTLEELERRAIKETLERLGGNRERAARMLGIGERTLYRKILKYGFQNTGRGTRGEA